MPLHDALHRTGRDPAGRTPEGEPSHQVLHLPSPLAAARHSLPAVVEGIVGPFALFYLVLVVAGFRGALLAGLGWSYLVLIRRLVRRERPPATVLIGSATLTVRTAISFATGSSFVYFAQPLAATCLMALLFLVSAAAGRPLAERLARDFCPLDPAVVGRPWARRFFVQISVLWASVLLTNVAVVTWLLLTSSLHAFVIERTLTTWVLTGGAIAVSVAWFRRTTRRNGVSVRWGGPGGTGAGLPGAATG